MKLFVILLAGFMALNTAPSYGMFLMPKPKIKRYHTNIKPNPQGFKKHKATQRDKNIAYAIQLHVKQGNYASSNKKSRTLNKMGIELIAQRALAAYTKIPLKDIQKSCASAAQ